MANTSMSLPMEGCQGYDTVLDDGRNVAVKGHRSVQGGAAVEMYYQVCESMEDARSTLQINQSLNLSFLSAGNIIEKVRFLNSLKLTTHSLAIVVYAKVVSGGHTITDAALTVAVPQNVQDMEAFVRAYGDSYVTKVVTGAEYYASYTYYTSTSEEKMSLVAKMRADGIFTWGSGDASIDAKITRFNSNNNVSVEFRQSMRGISGVALPEPTKMLDFVLNFPTLTIDMPQILHFSSSGYEYAPGFPVAHFAPVIKNRALIVEGTFLSNLSRVKGLKNDVQAIERNLSRYGMRRGSTAGLFLEEVSQAIKTDEAAVQLMLQTYAQNVMQEVIPPAVFRSLAYEERVQSSHWTEQKSQYIGTNDGGGRDYVKNVREFITSGRKITSIQLYADALVDRIIIQYSNGDSFDWGGRGGKSSNVLYVPEGVYFSRIRIKHNGAFVNYLEFELTNGNTLAGGDVNAPSNDNNYHPYQAPDYNYFCGFQLRSGALLDGIRPIFAKFITAPL